MTAATVGDMVATVDGMVYTVRAVQGKRYRLEPLRRFSPNGRRRRATTAVHVSFVRSAELGHFHTELRKAEARRTRDDLAGSRVATRAALRWLDAAEDRGVDPGPALRHAYGELSKLGVTA